MPPVRKIFVNKAGDADFFESQPPPQQFPAMSENIAWMYQMQMSKLLDNATRDGHFDSAIKGIFDSITSGPDTVSGLIRTIGEERIVRELFAPALKGDPRTKRVYLRTLLELVRSHLTAHELHAVEGISEITRSMDTTIRKLPPR
jgi:hypothetical protein